MRRAGQVVRTGANRNAYNVLKGKSRVVTQKNMAVGQAGPGTNNDCAGEGQ
jgi:hypothetical protein